MINRFNKQTNKKKLKAQTFNLDIKFIEIVINNSKNKHFFSFVSKKFLPFAENVRFTFSNFIIYLLWYSWFFTSSYIRVISSLLTFSSAKVRLKLNELLQMYFELNSLYIRHLLFFMSLFFDQLGDAFHLPLVGVAYGSFQTTFKKPFGHFEKMNYIKHC